MNMRFTIAAVIGLAASAPSLAWGAEEPARVEAADPGAPVAAQRYASPFAGYRTFREGEVGPWRAVNDEVGRIGGWRVYAREAHEAAEAAKAAAVPPRDERAGPAAPDGRGR